MTLFPREDELEMLQSGAGRPLLGRSAWDFLHLAPTFSWTLLIFSGCRCRLLGFNAEIVGWPDWSWHVSALRFTDLLINMCMKSMVVLRSKRSRQVLKIGPLIHVLGLSVITFVFACISSS